MTPESSPWQEHEIRERANIWGNICAERVQEDHRREALCDMEDFAFAVSLMDVFGAWKGSRSRCHVGHN